MRSAPVLALLVLIAAATAAHAQPVTLYTGASYGGSSFGVDADRATLPSWPVKIDNGVSSVRVPVGQVIAVYEGVNFNGRCTTLRADTPSFAALGIDDTISSLRVAWSCETGAVDFDACAAAPCGPFAACTDLPRPAPATAAGRFCRLPASAPDLARGAPTRQSTTGFGGVASRATDGNLDGVFNAGSVTSTNSGPNGWLEIDLGAPRAIGTVTVYNRTDCCSERLVGARIELSNDRCDLATRAIVATSATLDASLIQPHVFPAATARYVCLRQTSGAWVSVAEVTVFAPEAPAPPACAAESCVRWGFSAWGACSAPVNGAQARAAVCTDEATGATLPESRCIGSKPASETRPCHVFSWRAADWSACSALCGGGLQTRTVTCVDEDGAVGPNLNCSSAPVATQQACNPEPCVRWGRAAWGECSAPANGTQSRSAVCIDASNDTVLGDNACAGAKPPLETRACNVFAWRVDPWSECSKTCGGGVQTRTFACVNENGTLGPETSCQGARPSTQQACNVQVCAPN